MLTTRPARGALGNPPSTVAGPAGNTSSVIHHDTRPSAKPPNREHLMNRFPRLLGYALALIVSPLGATASHAQTPPTPSQDQPEPTTTPAMKSSSPPPVVEGPEIWKDPDQPP